MGFGVAPTTLVTGLPAMKAVAQGTIVEALCGFAQVYLSMVLYQQQQITFGHLQRHIARLYTELDAIYATKEKKRNTI